MMLLRICFFKLVFFLSITCFAQSTYTFPDYVVTNSFDTIYGVIDDVHFWGNTVPAISIEYTDEEGKVKKRTFSPDDCRSYYTHVLFESWEIRSLDSFVKIFVRKVIDGKLALYSYQKTRFSSKPTGFGSNQIEKEEMELYYFKRNNEYTLQPVRASKSQLIKYFIDCESLSLKIKNDELSKKKPEAIVDFYNTQCN